MASFHRIVRDGVFDTVTTDQLTANHVLVRHDLTAESIISTDITSTNITATNITATTITAATINVAVLNIPSVSLVIPDSNSVLTIPIPPTWTFSRVGDVVTAQLDTVQTGLVDTATFMRFIIPAPYSPTNVTNITQPILMSVDAGATYFFGVAFIGNGDIDIKPSATTNFLIGTTIVVTPATFTYIVS